MSSGRKVSRPEADAFYLDQFWKQLVKYHTAERPPPDGNAEQLLKENEQHLSDVIRNFILKEGVDRCFCYDPMFCIHMRVAWFSEEITAPVDDVTLQRVKFLEEKARYSMLLAHLHARTHCAPAHCFEVHPF